MSQTFPIQYINVSLSRPHFVKEVISDLLYVVMLIIVCLFYTQWLEKDFLKYLDTWEESVKSREKFTAAQKKQMLLRTETLLGIRRSGKTK